MYDHLNSGILKGGLDGPGLNIGLVSIFGAIGVFSVFLLFLSSIPFTEVGSKIKTI